MNYPVLIILSYFIVIVVKGEGEGSEGNKREGSEDGPFEVAKDQQRLGYSDWIVNSLNNTSSDIFWKNGLWQMWKMFRPIANYDKRREPNFIAFNAQDSIMTLDLNLGFPFIRIPVANTTNILSLAKDIYRRERPLINFDITAIAMVAMVTLISTLFSITLRTFFKPFAPREDPERRSNARKSRAATEDFDTVMNIFSMLNMALEKYGVNTNVCVQRMVCMYVKNAMIDRKARSSDSSHYNRIIEGLSRSDWALEYIEGTSIEYAIKLGRSESDCKRIFKRCNPDAWFYRNYDNGNTF